ncbi:hypothetical protein [Acidithiobacillus thiooxidans]|uniref:Uncharacterized protein n=1 Tax=Acidithiobacillus thiooxidans ATCC 19377 TaxID=637390 RepID=A0A543Q1R9_ACITH|nr:hypothetical protein [Acidithiobacillus thiooxidans]MDX5935653.1 hypothetical protein [Acidithiobacillus thiooxidans]TQN50248.1 hypothetical protein DLNHIDIE_00101 [Acidithiobacillus thiooxidans ATCC 19377]
MEPVNFSSEANVKCRAQRTQEMAQYCLDVLQRLSVVLTQADFATIESEIEARPDRNQVRASGAYQRGRKFAIDRLSTVKMFCLDKGGIQPLGFGFGKALYCDQEMGFFLCQNVFLEETDDEDAMTLSVQFVLFDNESDKLPKDEQIARFHPMAHRLLTDLCQKYQSHKDCVGKMVHSVYGLSLLDNIVVSRVEGEPPVCALAVCAESEWEDDSLTIFEMAPTKATETCLHMELYELTGFYEYLSEPVRTDWTQWLQDWLNARSIES